MATFDHWMRFHVGDYLADTMHLSTFQHGIYVLLIMHYFKRRGLPSDEAALCRIAKVHPAHWRRYSGPVISLFHRDEFGCLRHARIDREIDICAAISERRRNAGKLGASARWDMANAIKSDGKRMANLARAGATPEPETESPPYPPTADAAGGGADAGPDSGGRKGTRADGTNPRTLGSNPRANGTNPRANGTHPRASRNAMVDIVLEEQEARTDAAAGNAHRRGAEVVPIVGNSFRRQHDA